MDYTYQDPSKSPSLVRALFFLAIVFYGGGQLIAWGTQTYLEREWEKYKAFSQQTTVEIVSVDPGHGINLKSSAQTYFIGTRNTQGLAIGEKLTAYVDTQNRSKARDRVRVEGLNHDIPPTFIFMMLGFIFASFVFVPTAVFLSAAKFIGTHEIQDFVEETEEDLEDKIAG